MIAAILLSLLAAGLAGCIGSDDAAPPGGTGPETGPAGLANGSAPTFPSGDPAPRTYAVEGCTLITGVFPVQASAYEHRVPDGFTLVPYRGAPGDPTAQVSVSGLDCELDNGTSAALAWTELAVEVPEAFENPNATIPGGLLLAVVTDSPYMAALQAAWGFDPVLLEGELSFDQTKTPAAHLGELVAETTAGSFSASTSVDGHSIGASSGVERIFAAREDGTLTGAKDIEFTANQVVIGGAEASGSPNLGLPDRPLHTGEGAHVYGLGATYAYADLPPREES